MGFFFLYIYIRLLPFGHPTTEYLRVYWFLGGVFFGNTPCILDTRIRGKNRRAREYIPAAVSVIKLVLPQSFLFVRIQQFSLTLMQWLPTVPLSVHQFHRASVYVIHRRNNSRKIRTFFFLLNNDNV